MDFPEDLLAKYPSLRKIEEQGDDYVEWNDGREDQLVERIKQQADSHALQGNPTAILQAMDDFSNQQDMLISIGSEKARILKDLLVKQKPRVVVELGGYLGYSAILFAEVMRRASSGDEAIHVWSLEYNAKFAATAKELVALAGLSDLVTVVTGSAEASLRKLVADKQLVQVDLLFLDHDENLYEQDLKVCEELGLLKAGACLVADNVVRPGAPRYREYVRGHTGFESEGVPGLIMPGEFADELEVSTVL